MWLSQQVGRDREFLLRLNFLQKLAKVMRCGKLGKVFGTVIEVIVGPMVAARPDGIPRGWEGEGEGREPSLLCTLLFWSGPILGKEKQVPQGLVLELKHKTKRNIVWLPPCRPASALG